MIGHAVGKMIGKPMLNLEQICAKEDPEKVRAFLADVANEPSLPPSVRDACRKLLGQYESGKPIGDALAEGTQEQIAKLNEDLQGGISNGK